MHAHAHAQAHTLMRRHTHTFAHTHVTRVHTHRSTHVHTHAQTHPHERTVLHEHTDVHMHSAVACTRPRAHSRMHMPTRGAEQHRPRSGLWRAARCVQAVTPWAGRSCLRPRSGGGRSRPRVPAWVGPCLGGCQERELSATGSGWDWGCVGRGPAGRSGMQLVTSRSWRAARGLSTQKMPPRRPPAASRGPLKLMGMRGEGPAPEGDGLSCR